MEEIAVIDSTQQFFESKLEEYTETITEQQITFEQKLTAILEELKINLNNQQDTINAENKRYLSKIRLLIFIWCGGLTILGILALIFAIIQ